jgi:hypothetical protein
LRLLVSSYIGFSFSKTCWASPLKKSILILGGEEDIPNRIPMSTIFTR